MHYRRPHPRGKGKRSRSSNWSYPRVEQGRDAQSRYSTAKRTAAANDDIAAFVKDPADMEQYDMTEYYYQEFADPGWEDWYEETASYRANLILIHSGGFRNGLPPVDCLA